MLIALSFHSLLGYSQYEAIFKVQLALFQWYSILTLIARFSWQAHVI
jgi:hypothetical protein